MKLSEMTNAEDILRWHYEHDCNCNCPVEYFEYPAEHLSSCPLHNPLDEAWNYNL